MAFFLKVPDIYTRDAYKRFINKLNCQKMNNVEQKTFLQSGKKEVVYFIAAPQRFASQQAAIDALNQAVRHYEMNCGKGYNEYREPDNPFVAIVIHGINE